LAIPADSLVSEAAAGHGGHTAANARVRSRVAHVRELTAAYSFAERTESVMESAVKSFPAKGAKSFMSAPTAPPRVEPVAGSEREPPDAAKSAKSKSEADSKTTAKSEE
jgi:hypothetical protein